MSIPVVRVLCVIRFSWEKKFKKLPTDKLILIRCLSDLVFVFAGVVDLLLSTATPRSLRAASPVLSHFLFFNPVLYEAVDSSGKQMERRAPKRLDGGGTRWGGLISWAMILHGGQDRLGWRGFESNVWRLTLDTQVELETRPFPFDSCTPVLYTVSSYVGQSRE